jgi:hypothetical protein
MRVFQTPRDKAQKHPFFFPHQRFFVTHFYFLQKVQKWKEKERDALHIYKTLNSWGDTKDGKNLSKKKKWFRGRHTTEEERRKKKVWPINHININHHHGESVAGRLESAVRHAARVRRRIAFVAERMRTTTIVFRRRLFFFVFLFFLPRARIIIFIVVFVSLFFSCVVCLRIIVCVA